MTDLITIDKYKEIEGISSTKEDVKLEIFIPSVSQLVKTYCGNSILDYFTVNKVEDFSLTWDSTFLQLTESPVNTIVEIQERRRPTENYSILDSNEYYLDTKTDSVIRIPTKYQYWPQGPGSVLVTYSAGYAATPADLLLAGADLVTYYLKDEHKQRQTLQGASIENARSGGNANNPAFPDHIKRVLDLYKNF